MTRFLAHPAGYGTHVTDTSAKKSPKMTHAAPPVISLPQSNHFLSKAEETLKPSLSLLVPEGTCGHAKHATRHGSTCRHWVSHPKVWDSGKNPGWGFRLRCWVSASCCAFPLSNAPGHDAQNHAWALLHVAHKGGFITCFVVGNFFGKG